MQSSHESPVLTRILKFTLEISTTDNDDEVEMELCRICNSKSTKAGIHAKSWVVSCNTIEDIETLSDNINKLIDSQKGGGGGGGYDTTNQSGNCCSAIFRLTGVTSVATGKAIRRSYEIMENNILIYIYNNNNTAFNKQK